MLHASDGAQLSQLPATVKLRSDVLIRRLAHAAPKSIPKNRPLVCDRLPLKDTFTGKGHGLSSEVFFLWLIVQLSGAFAGCGDNLLRLISEGGGHLFVGRQNFSRRERLFPISCRMRRDLRRLGAAVTAFFELLSDLSRPWAGGIKILLGIPFDLGCAAPAGFDFVSKTAELVGKRRLIERRSHTAGFRRRPVLAKRGSNRFPAP